MELSRVQDLSMIFPSSTSSMAGTLSLEGSSTSMAGKVPLEGSSTSMAGKVPLEGRQGESESSVGEECRDEAEPVGPAQVASARTPVSSADDGPMLLVHLRAEKQLASSHEGGRATSRPRSRSPRSERDRDVTPRSERDHSVENETALMLEVLPRSTEAGPRRDLADPLLSERDRQDSVGSEQAPISPARKLDVARSGDVELAGRGAPNFPSGVGAAGDAILNVDGMGLAPHMDDAGSLDGRPILGFLLNVRSRNGRGRHWVTVKLLDMEDSRLRGWYLLDSSLLSPARIGGLAELDAYLWAWKEFPDPDRVVFAATRFGGTTLA